jgi:hypothetical protein
VTTCDWCFAENTNIPLTAGNVDILREWCLEVPIESQLVLEKFINVRSLKKTKDKQLSLTLSCIDTPLLLGRTVQIQISRHIRAV